MGYEHLISIIYCYEHPTNNIDDMYRIIENEEIKLTGYIEWRHLYAYYRDLVNRQIMTIEKVKEKIMNIRFRFKNSEIYRQIMKTDILMKEKKIIINRDNKEIMELKITLPPNNTITTDDGVSIISYSKMKLQEPDGIINIPIKNLKTKRFSAIGKTQDGIIKFSSYITNKIKENIKLIFEFPLSYLII